MRQSMLPCHRNTQGSLGVLKHISLLITALTALLVGMPAAQAQTITNVAAAQWSQGSSNYSVNSNAVTFALTSSGVSIRFLGPMARPV